jgi:hypothetical protein
VVLSLLLVTACTTPAYPGPRRPGSEVATIEARDVAIDAVDGLDVRGKSNTFEILAGPRYLVAHLSWRRNIPVSGASTNGMGTSPLSIRWGRQSGPTGICFIAVPGHRYVIEPQTESVPWINYVVEPQTSGAVWAPFVADGASDKPAPMCGPGPQTDGNCLGPPDRR